MKPDPALGFPVTFPTDQFNRAIRFAMQMGAPVDPDKRLKFVFPSPGDTYWRDGVQITTPRVDRDGRPLDPEIEVRAAPQLLRELDCAVETSGGMTGGEGPVGNFPIVRLTVTLLEEQYLLAKGCEGVLYNGDRYVYDHEPDNYGLFDAGVHTMIFVSEDET